MSSNTCGNCDCADKAHCVKKGSEYDVETVGTQKGYAAEIMEFSAAAEHNGKCKCGPNCSCIDCNCGN